MSSFISLMRTRLTAALVLALSLLALLPASAHAATYYGWFDYARNNSNDNGCFSYGYIVNDCPPIHALYMRGGSGIYRDDRKNGGWLPGGFYSIRGHWDNYAGTSIFGRVFYLSDKYNSVGVLRTALFIHTEETPWNGQYNPTAGDDPQCWEGPIDYRSMGCIKLAYPYDIHTAHWYWNFYGGTTAHGSGYPYPMSSRLYVH